MEELIRDNIADLCLNTIVDELLLVLLYQAKVITEISKDQINSKSTPFGKASELYTYMKKRPENNLQLLIKALRESGNDKPADLLETQRQQPGQSSTESVISKTPGTTESPFVRASDIVKTICKDSAIIRNWQDLKGPLKVRDSEFVILKQWMLEDSKEFYDVILLMIELWVDRAEKNATVKGLMEVLKKNNFLIAAELLVIYPENRTLVTK